MKKTSKQMVEEDEDFINIKRFDNSVAKLLVRYPDGCPDRIAATALMMTEEEVRELFADSVQELRQIIGISTEADND